MKSFIAVALAHAPRFLENDLETPVHLCFSYDEEVGCKGVPHLLAFPARPPGRPAMGVVGHPSEKKVNTGAKAQHSNRCHRRRKATPASQADRNTGVSGQRG